ncbi:MAG: ATP-binding protein [Alphaproteobacteria bacterium]
MNDDSRPDPDELLNRITAEENEAQQESTRGKLKIFFGACAGVGKTYAMLSAGKQALAEGIDVVIGLVETHGREETKKLLDGLPILPYHEVKYRGTLIKEFDIDAALARKPQLILLDELAHTNAPGSRHPKRWQDVQELLSAGINVFTTINVQHLESLNDVVARITGIWVKETVPDEVFDKADEISLVDIPSEELLKRLKEGKVYIAPDAKKRAAQNFFKKSNLIALRELALRRTAERVDALMDVYKTPGGGGTGWSGADRILVCIGSDQLSTKLVRVAKRVAGGLKAPWTAVYVENERHYRLSKEGQESVQRTIRLAERMGAKVETIQGHKASQDILEYARANNITKIVVGKITRPRWRELITGTLADDIMRGSGDIDVYVVTGDQEENKTVKSTFWSGNAPWHYYIAPVLSILASSLALLPFQSLLETIHIVMVYLIVIVAISVRYGRGPSVLTTILAALSLNFFFIVPYYTFKMAQEHHFMTFLVLLLTGIIIGAQTSQLRMQVLHARKREKNSSSLFTMSRDLNATRDKVALAQIAAQQMSDVFDSDVFLWLPDSKGQLQTVVAEGDMDEESIDPIREESVAVWSFTHRQNAGFGTDTLPSAKALYVPLVSSSGVVGVVGAMPHDSDLDAYSTEDVDLLETFSTIAATALDRAQAAEMVERTLVEAESEKLRNILLSSVSHDLRTPLAAITSAASTLLIEGEKISDAYKGELLHSIHEEGARLAKIVTNLLDVSSLESGAVKLNKELYFIEELIGSALMRVEQRFTRHKVITNIENGLPLLRIDGLLIEQVLINLLENAAEFTPSGTTVSVSATMVKPDIHVMIADNGPGIPRGDEEKIFDKFYASEKSGNKGGGLGLAICRGIVRAHGGKIWAQNTSEGGAMFTLTLPIKSQDAD